MSMAIRFRKSMKIAPGLRLNLGKKSASVRIGGKNAGFTTGTAGKTVSASIPGTGLGVTKRVGGTNAGPGISWPIVIGAIVGVLLVLAIVGALIGTR
jgi:hypothetical protein